MTCWVCVHTLPSQKTTVPTFYSCLALSGGVKSVLPPSLRHPAIYTYIRDDRGWWILTWKRPTSTANPQHQPKRMQAMNIMAQEVPSDWGGCGRGQRGVFAPSPSQDCWGCDLPVKGEGVFHFHSLPSLQGCCLGDTSHGWHGCSQFVAGEALIRKAAAATCFPRGTEEALEVYPPPSHRNVWWGSVGEWAGGVSSSPQQNQAPIILVLG